MEVQTVQQWKKRLVKICKGGSKSRAGCAWVVDCMAFLSRTFRVDAQSDRFSSIFGTLTILFKLSWGIEYKVIGNFQEFTKFLFTIGRGENVGLTAKIIVTELCLIKAAGCSAGEIFPNNGVGRIHRKGFLCQQNFTAGARAHRL